MKVKRKRWTRGEEKYVIENCEQRTYEEMAKKLNRTINSVKQKVYFLRRKNKGMEKVNNYQRWTAEEEEKLVESYGKIKTRQIANMLNRPINSIHSKIYSLGLPAGEIKIENKEQVREVDKKNKEKEVQAIYDRMLNEKVIAGVYREDLKVKIGQSYEVTRNQGRMLKGDWITFKGKVIQETKYHITIKNKTRTETFLKADLLIGEYKIKEVS